MDLSDFTTAVALQKTIDLITDIQAKLGADDAEGRVIVTDDKGAQIVDSNVLKSVLGATYGTLGSDSLNTLNGDLTSAKSAAQNAFDLLGA